MSFNHLLPRSEADKFLKSTCDDSWEKLKPVIVEMYMRQRHDDGKSLSIAQVAKFMRDNYAFHAAESQYKNWFSLQKWNIRRRTLAEEKEDITSALGRRKRDDTSTSDVRLQQGDNEKRVDTNQLKRHLRDKIRKDQVQPLTAGVLSSWNLPYPALTASITKVPDHPSPFGSAAATPGHVIVNSPSPGRQVNRPSPAMQMVREAVLGERSSLFCQGRHQELLMRCGPEDRVLLTNFLHDFYIHSFVVAKYWGRGPRAWTGSMVSTLTLDTLDGQNVHTPGSSANSPAAQSPSMTQHRRPRLQPPTSACLWAIHVTWRTYEAIPETNHQPAEEFDAANTSAWTPWTDGDSRTSSFPAEMRESITGGTFTRLPPEDLPISIDAVSRSIRENPTALEADAWKMAILVGNYELLDDLFVKNQYKVPDSVLELHPLHLAGTYLDGGKSCCRVISTLGGMLPRGYVFRNPLDDLGHTILDSILVVILRSHTAVTPDHVSPQLGSSTRFPGEEKDPCGRWDADTPAIRKLLQLGYPRIPKHWKHPFCHSSVQAVCHGTIGVFGSPMAPRINTLSGLFVRRCGNCGAELKLGPLHSVIVVSFYLAQMGMTGETLFGSLALLVCLLRLGADAKLAPSISAEAILSVADASRCDHVNMTARQLMNAVPQDIVSGWTADCKRGWRCLMQSLLLAENGFISKASVDGDMSAPQATVRFTELELSPNTPSRDMVAFDTDASETGSEEVELCCVLDIEDYGDAHDDWVEIPRGNAELGVLWATIQVEILTYRRLGETDPWISELFSMHALEKWLGGETSHFATPLIERGLMTEHTKCGWFWKSDDFFCPIAEDVCKFHFMNMDVNKRTTFSYRPSFVEAWSEIVRPSDMDE